MKFRSSHLYEFGDFRMDAEKRLLWRRDGAAVRLTPRVFDTLLYLVEHNGTLLDKERLMDAVWPDSIVEENNLSQNISTLRHVFGENPGSHRFIVTVPGRGYRFVADVKARQDYGGPEEISESASQTETDQVVSAAQSNQPVGRRNLRAILLTTSAVLALSLVVLFFWRSRAQNPVASSASMAIPEKSIAVLPLENLSDEKDNAFFADGIQDDILTSLAKIRDLKVISRVSASQYRGAGAARNLREIAGALGVAHILEGSVRRAGNRMIVNVQLVDARSDRHIWAERYDRTVADSIGLQGELATEIAAALRAKLAPEEKAHLDAKPTNNPEAYGLYLKARGREGAVNRSTEDEIAAERLYAQAIALDPSLPPPTPGFPS